MVKSDAALDGDLVAAPMEFVPGVDQRGQDWDLAGPRWHHQRHLVRVAGPVQQLGLVSHLTAHFELKSGWLAWGAAIVLSAMSIAAFVARS